MKIYKHKSPEKEIIESLLDYLSQKNRLLERISHFLTRYSDAHPDIRVRSMAAALAEEALRHSPKSKTQQSA